MSISLPDMNLIEYVNSYDLIAKRFTDLKKIPNDDFEIMKNIDILDGSFIDETQKNTVEQFLKTIEMEIKFYENRILFHKKRYSDTTKSGYFLNIKTIHLGFLKIFVSLKSIFLCLLDVKKNKLNIRQDFFDKRYNNIFLLYYLRTQYVSNLKAFEILIQIFGEILPRIITNSNNLIFHKNYLDIFFSN